MLKLCVKGRSPSPLNDISILTPKLANSVISSEQNFQHHPYGMAQSRRSSEIGLDKIGSATNNNISSTSIYGLDITSSDAYLPFAFDELTDSYGVMTDLPKDSNSDLRISHAYTTLGNGRVSIQPTSMGFYPGIGKIRLDNLPWFRFQEESNSRKAQINSSSFTNDENFPLADVFGLTEGANAVERISQLQSRMKNFSLERYDGELPTKVRSFFDTSNNRAFSQAVEFFLHLTSNNLVSSDQIVEFSHWIIKQNQSALLETLLQFQLPTIHAFATRLLESAVEIGDAHFLQLLIDTGFDRSAMSRDYGGRLLLIAAECKNTQAARILIRHDADVNISLSKDDPLTALHLAVDGGNAELVQMLLEAGAVVETLVDDDGETALSLAIEKNDIDLITILIQAGADVDSCLIDNTAAMDWAEWNSSSKVYQLLCYESKEDYSQYKRDDIVSAASQGPEFLLDYLNVPGQDIMSDHLERALQYELAKDGSQNAIMALLAIGVDPDADPHSSWAQYPLVSAVENEDIDLVKILLEAGADANIVPDILEKAATHSNPEFLRLLLDHGADIQTYGGRALWTAAGSENLEIARLLVASGADINYRYWESGSRSGTTTLQRAAGSVEMVQFLVSAGANVNAQASGKLGYTALQLAINWGLKGSVKALLNAGADINAPGNFGTALEVALICQPNDIDLVKYLLSQGAHVSTGENGSDLRVLQIAIRWGNPEIVKLLLNAGANVNSPPSGEKGKSPLQEAASRGNISLLELLLKAGADVNAAAGDKYGTTAIQAAASRGHVNSLKLLLRAGADVNAAASDTFGKTALQAAASAKETNMELIDVLLKAGADINAPAAFGGGITALQGAAIRGHIQIAVKLLEMGADVNADSAEIDGRIAIDGAAEHGRLDMVQLLINAGARGNLPHEGKFTRAIDLALKNDHFAVAKLLKDLD